MDDDLSEHIKVKCFLIYKIMKTIAFIIFENVE